MITAVRLQGHSLLRNQRLSVQPQDLKRMFPATEVQMVRLQLLQQEELLLTPIPGRLQVERQLLQVACLPVLIQ